MDPVVLEMEAGGRTALFSGTARHALALFDPSEPGQGSEGQPPYAMLHGLFWLLAGIAAAQPVLLIVDDAHWCDPASAGFLSFLTRRSEGVSVGLLRGPAL